MAGNIPSFIATIDTLQASGPLYQMIKTLPDGIHEGSTIANYLNKKGRESWDRGGEYINYNIVMDRMRGESYSGEQTLTATRKEFLKQMSVIRGQYKIGVKYLETDLMYNQNSPDAQVKYIAKQLEVARQGFSETLDLALLGDGTTRADGTAEEDTHCIIGFEKILETTPASSSSVIGGQTRSATTTWLNNQALSVANLAAVNTSTLMQMKQLCTHLGKSPNAIFMSDTAFRSMWNLAKGESWLKESKMAVDLGYPESIDFMGTPIIPCKAMTGSSAGGLITTDMKRIYFVNIGEGLQWYVDPKFDMVLGPVLSPTDQATYVQYITFSGQVILLNPRLNGVIYWA